MLDQSHFAYDQNAPLALTILSERTQNSATIQDIAYTSPKGGKVSGYLIFSSKQPPVAGLIFGHWGQGNRDEFVNEALLLTRLGFVSLFFQFAHVDDFIAEDEGQRYFDLASEPKKIVWYDNCNHELNAPARLDRATWLCTALGLPRPAQAVLDLLEEVPSPRPLQD